VGDQTAVSTGAGGQDRIEILGSANECVSDENAHGGGLDITFDAGELSSDEEVGAGTEFEPSVEGFGGFDIGVAVDDTHADELGILKTRHHFKDFELRAPFDSRLAGNERVEGFFTVFGAELESGPRSAVRAGIAEADGFEITESE